MGESKQRKSTDPDYGKYSTKLRGLIVSAPIEINGASAIIKRADLDPQDLRSSLLYWDRLSMPTSNLIHIQGGADVKYLEDCGILSRKRYSCFGDGATSLITVQNQNLQELDQIQPGIWSLGAGENSILVKHGVATPDKGTLMELYNAIPVPKENTPLAEILEFKQRRRSELLIFRAYMEGLSREITDANDSVDELNKKLALLDSACSDLIKTTREFRLPIYLSNHSASLNFETTKLYGTAFATWTAAKSLGLDITTSTVAAAILTGVSLVSFKSDIKLQSLKRASSPFKYIYKAQQHLG